MADDEDNNEQQLFQLETGELVYDWKVAEQIGAGNYGNVYHVINEVSKKHGAMKVESRNIDTDNRVLRIEGEVLRAMGEKKDVLRLFAAGHRIDFDYIVMTLVGPDLTRMLQKCGGKFSESTTLQLAIRGMYALKQMHDVGYLHRDLKPCNFATSATQSKIVYLIDFGMTRRYSFLGKDGKKGGWKFAPPRKSSRFRGTICYCSPNMHDRKEQGRNDDLISLFYVCIDMHSPLIWRTVTNEERVKYIKQDTPEEQICDPKKKGICTIVLAPILKHLRHMDYYERPDYLHIFNEILKEMTTRKLSLNDPYDWELPFRKGSLPSIPGTHTAAVDSTVANVEFKPIPVKMDPGGKPQLMPAKIEVKTMTTSSENTKGGSGENADKEEGLSVKMLEDTGDDRTEGRAMKNSGRSVKQDRKVMPKRSARLKADGTHKNTKPASNRKDKGGKSEKKSDKDSDTDDPMHKPEKLNSVEEEDERTAFEKGKDSAEVLRNAFTLIDVPTYKAPKKRGNTVRKRAQRSTTPAPEHV